MNPQTIFKKLSEMHPNAKCELDFSTPFELLVAVILSAQCTDKRVNMATKELFKVYNTPEQFAALNVEDLKPYIFSCGFYNNKGKNIIAMSADIVKKHGGVVPSTMEELTALAGVGRKTASVVLAAAFEIPAIAVDTHAFRVSNRLGLSSGNTPEKVEFDLRALYPEEQWIRLHHLLVFHGRYICHSQKPDCGACLLTEECPAYKEFINKRGKNVSR
ncbi:MAG: endonuclease III [Clostridiales bacterium]|jgi:endonuclease-3|nr:endonuclease III [Clostridiales bacterium]HOB64849.1 endonuclease III [Clostridia bacterium]HOK81319.1 endonuclease III [Clostridia bacterium]HOL60438.1 endonuclease III [Clostridia bacterium]HPO53195.1 endonuclease III [Clostridia bacterium]